MGRYRADIGWHKSLCGHSPFHVLGRECFLGLESFSTQVVTSDHEEVASRQNQFVIFSLWSTGRELKNLGVIAGLTTKKEDNALCLCLSFLSALSRGAVIEPFIFSLERVDSYL